VVKQVYQVKKKDNGAENSEATKGNEWLTSSDVIEIGTIKVPVMDLEKRQIFIEELAKRNDTSAIDQKPMANDHEASISKKDRDPKYIQLRWCPSGLSRTKKRRLKWLRTQEKVDKHAEKQRDEFLNQIRPMRSPKQVWKPKQVDVPAAPTPCTEVSIATPSVPTPNEDEEMVDYESTPSHEVHKYGLLLTFILA
jgi:hypothetical protein